MGPVAACSSVDLVDGAVGSAPLPKTLPATVSVAAGCSALRPARSMGAVLGAFEDAPSSVVRTEGAEGHGLGVAAPPGLEGGSPGIAISFMSERTWRSALAFCW